MTSYRLQSSTLVFTPGIVRWARVAGPDGRKALEAAFPTVCATAIDNLMQGKYEVLHDAVIVLS